MKTDVFLGAEANIIVYINVFLLDRYHVVISYFI